MTRVVVVVVALGLVACGLVVSFDSQTHWRVGYHESRTKDDDTRKVYPP